MMPTRTLVLLLALRPALLAEEPQPVKLVDFEREEPADGWSIRGLTLVETTDDRGRRALKIVGDGKVGHIRRAPPVRDWRSFDALGLRVRAEAGAPVEMRVRAIRGQGPANLLRRFTLEPGGWHDIVLPLKEFRDDNKDQICDFSRIDQWMLQWDATAGEVTLLELRLTPGTRGVESCRASAQDQIELAFPGGAARSFESEHFLLLSEAHLEVADAFLLLQRCEEGLAFLREGYRLPGALQARAPLLLFQRREDLHACVRRIESRFGIGIGLDPGADRCQVLGRALCVAGLPAPAVAAMAAKVATHDLLGITNNPTWLQEGLAAAVERRLRGDDDVAAAGGLGFLAGDKRPPPAPWSRFFSKGGNPGTWQSMSILEFVRTAHGERLPAFWMRVLALETPLHESAPAALAATLGLALEDLEAAWLESLD